MEWHWGPPTSWVGVSLFFLWGLWLLAGALIIPDHHVLTNTKYNKSQNQAAWVVLTTATGISLSLFFWMISAYLVHGFLPGTCILFATSLAGAIHLYRRPAGTNLHPPTQSVVILVSFALLLGAFHYFFIEFQWNDNSIFSGFYRRDLFIHVYSSSLLKENGLPLIDMTGNPTTPFSAPSHTGLIVLIAGIASLTKVTLFQTTRIIVPIGYAIFVFYALSFVARSNLDRRLIFVASAAILVWRGLSVPFDVFPGNWRGVIAPYNWSIIKPNCPAGSLYHNLTQLYSVVLTGAALLALHIYIQKKISYFILSCCFIGITFLVKPFISTLTMPTMLTFLFLRREKRDRWLVCLALFASAIFIYYIPVLFQDIIPKTNQWIIRRDYDPIEKIILKYSVLLGIILIYAGNRLLG